jgi:hypothetical protein
MRTCQPLSKTGDHDRLICNDCGAVFTADKAMLSRRGRKKPLPKNDIRYWYLVPVRITYHYWSDGEESVVDTVLDIPMTEPFITDLEEATTERNTTQEKVLEESINALLVEVQQDLARRLPPEVQQDCTITVTITGTISHSKKPLD